MILIILIFIIGLIRLWQYYILSKRVDKLSEKVADLLYSESIEKTSADISQLPKTGDTNHTLLWY